MLGVAAGVGLTVPLLLGVAPKDMVGVTLGVGVGLAGGRPVHTMLTLPSGPLAPPLAPPPEALRA